MSFINYISKKLDHGMIFLKYLLDRKNDEFIDNFEVNFVLKNKFYRADHKQFDGVALEVVVPSDCSRYCALVDYNSLETINTMFYNQDIVNPRIKITGSIVRSSKVLLNMFNNGSFDYEGFKNLERILMTNKDCYVVRHIECDYPNFDDLKKQIDSLDVSKNLDK